MSLIIRKRERRVASPSEGQRGAWQEYQVLDGRKIIGRYDLLSEAKRAYPLAAPTPPDLT